MAAIVPVPHLLSINATDHLSLEPFLIEPTFLLNEEGDLDNLANPEEIKTQLLKESETLKQMHAMITQQISRLQVEETVFRNELNRLEQQRLQIIESQVENVSEGNNESMSLEENSEEYGFDDMDELLQEEGA
eukprot:TRINITY_DN1513_c0_g1_i4.p1 TRINITY_DN1513_c0_g1~~TRINITY_DN1513_c0_g1_i4.p1  ORF type:complete len:133 (-),score=37.36 TRINITY_DN1513_c0_g1_i4:36-434(-)